MVYRVRYVIKDNYNFCYFYGKLRHFSAGDVVDVLILQIFSLMQQTVENAIYFRVLVSCTHYLQKSVVLEMDQV